MKRCPYILWAGLGAWLAAAPAARAAEAATNAPAVEPAGAGFAAQPPSPVEVLMKEGRSLLTMGPDLALAKFQEVLTREPGHAQAKLASATALIKLRRYADAERFLNELVAEHPDDFVLLNNLAWMYATASDPAFRNGERAVELARAALMGAPDDYHVWSTLAEAYYAAGQYERALKAAEEALRGGQRDPNASEYQRQVDKCRQTLDALSLIE